MLYSKVSKAALLSTSKHLVRIVLTDLSLQKSLLQMSLETPYWPVNQVHRLAGKCFHLFTFHTGTYFPILKSKLHSAGTSQALSVCNHLFMHHILREGIVIPAVILYSASTLSRPFCAIFTALSVAPQ